MSARRHWKLLYLQAHHMTALFDFLSHLAKHLHICSAAKSHCIAREQNGTVVGQRMLDDEWTEQPKPVVDDVTGIGAQIEEADRTLEVAVVAIVAHSRQRLMIVLAQTEIVDDETLHWHESGEILDL